MKSRGKQDRRALVQSAFRVAHRREEPNVDRLVAAVPRMMAEARRRRQLRPDPIAAILPVARWAVPGMAAAAAVLVLAASLAALLGPTPAAGTATGADSLILTGSAGGDASDPLLEVLAGRGG